MHAPSALYSQLRHAARPFLLCRSPLVILQAAAVARFTSWPAFEVFYDREPISKDDIVVLASRGDIERVRDVVIANLSNPSIVNYQSYEEDWDEQCDARHLYKLLKKNRLGSGVCLNVVTLVLFSGDVLHCMCFLKPATWMLANS